jgi:putative molybdopterin biosynthesis protein
MGTRRWQPLSPRGARTGGVCIESVARQVDLGFLPVQEERYDFAVVKSRTQRPAVQESRRLLADPAIRNRLWAAELLVD